MGQRPLSRLNVIFSQVVGAGYQLISTNLTKRDKSINLYFVKKK